MKILNADTLTAIMAIVFSTGTMADISTQQEILAKKNIINATYKTEIARCDALTDHAQDICMSEAKGKQRIAKAELTASFDTSNKAQYNVSITKAAAAYALAKEYCDDKSGDAKDACTKTAHAAMINTEADAKALLASQDLNVKTNEKTADINKTTKVDGINKESDLK